MPIFFSKKDTMNRIDNHKGVLVLWEGLPSFCLVFRSWNILFPFSFLFFEFARIRIDWSLEHLGKVVVDFASVSDEKNYYLIFLRVYLVDYSIVAYSGAPEIWLAEGFSDFVWAFAELFCVFDYSVLNVSFGFLKLFCCFGMQHDGECHSISSILTRFSGCFFASSLRFMSMLKKLIVFSRSS